MNNPQTICLTGMHRSGTSLVASWLQKCGLQIDDGNLAGGNISNPKGHFEDVDFVNAHLYTLLEQSRRSQGWKVCTKKFLNLGASQLGQALELVRIRHDKYPLWGWKDPRTVLFLKHWRELIPNLKVILVWRPCSEVVDSLIRRSKKLKNEVTDISIMQAAALWKSYNLLAYSYKEQFPDDTILVPLSYVLNNDQDALGYINERFQVALTYSPIDQLYTSELLHVDAQSPSSQVASLLIGAHSVQNKLRKLSDRT